MGVLVGTKRGCPSPEWNVEVQYWASRSSIGYRVSVSSVGIWCRGRRPSEGIGSSCVGTVFRCESVGEVLIFGTLSVGGGVVGHR
jgi:hypothetical protein